MWAAGKIKAVSLEDEQKLLRYYASKLQGICQALQFPDKVRATALIYLKRAYLSFSILDHNPKNIILACIYLAGKVCPLVRHLCCLHPCNLLRRTLLTLTLALMQLARSFIERHRRFCWDRCKACLQIEESYIGAEDLCRLAKQEEDLVLKGETILLEALGFDLVVFSPYRPLQGFLTVGCKSLSHTKDVSTP